MSILLLDEIGVRRDNNVPEKYYRFVKAPSGLRLVVETFRKNRDGVRYLAETAVDADSLAPAEAEKLLQTRINQLLILSEHIPRLRNEIAS